MDSRLCYSEADIVGSNATVGSIGAKLLGATTTTTDTEAPPSHSHVRSECCPGASPVIVQEREEQVMIEDILSVCVRVQGCVCVCV